MTLGPARVAVFTWARPRARTGLQESFESKLMPVFLQAIAGVRLNSTGWHLILTWPLVNTTEEAC